MNLLNPWIIEIGSKSDFEISLRLVSKNTGECRMTILSVDAIANIIIVGNSRIAVAADLIEDNAVVQLNELLGIGDDEK